MADRLKFVFLFPYNLTPDFGLAMFGPGIFAVVDVAKSACENGGCLAALLLSFRKLSWLDHDHIGGY